LTELHRILDVASAAANDAVAVHREFVGRVPTEQWASKGAAADFVSHVDREAEARVIARVRAAFPEHHILAEESGASEPDVTGVGPPRWIIDPLDGTVNFLHGYPMFAVSIAVIVDGEPGVGVVIDGASGRRWTAVRGEGAFLDGERITVSGRTRMADALIGTGFPFRAHDMLPGYLRQFDRVIRQVAGIRRAGAAALDLCHVATGWFDGFWELALAPWDVAAGALIVREAGGIITTPDGAQDVIRHGAIVAGNPAVHALLMTALAEANAED
jgi:myo-inositol-1(or 4)-monophosphatase